MNLKSIRDNLCLARLALGPEHPLSVRLETVERLPKIMPPHVVSAARGITGRAVAEVPPGVNDAIKKIADAIELL